MSKSRPTLKTCPQCRLAMQASRSIPRGRFDTFTCLRCDLVVTYKSDELDTPDTDAER